MDKTDRDCVVDTGGIDTTCLCAFIYTACTEFCSETGRLLCRKSYRDADRGHILENIVYLELLRRDYRVCIGKVGETEVDFVAEKPDDKLYVQVTESMLSPETRERELRPLQMIPDNYEKIVLSMDWDFIKSYDGIKSLNLLDWLLDKK